MFLFWAFLAIRILLFCVIFPNKEPEPLVVDGALEEASLNSPSPTPVLCVRTHLYFGLCWGWGGRGLLFGQMAESPFSQRWKTRRGSDFWSRLGSL